RGQNVVVFINGQEATDVDLSTFWPKDVIRVEYLSEPSDPKFKGYNAVVNFILPEYSVGGVTRANTYQSLLPYLSRYIISSKLVYKSMTYGVMVDGYMRNEHAGQTRNINSDIYRGIWYKGKKYDELTNTGESTGNENASAVNAAFNAIYTGKDNKVRLIHTAGFAWSRMNGRSDVTNNWDPGIFSSNVAWNSDARTSLSPKLSGSYYFNLSSKFQLSADWRYSYASIDNNTANRTADLPVISNGSKEKANAVNLVALLTYIFNPKASLQLQLVDNINTYSIQYAGTYDNLSRQTMNTSKVAVRGYWQPLNNLVFVAIPGFTVNSRSIKGLKSEASVNPYFYAALNWYQSDNAYINIDGNYYLMNVNASAANEVLQRQSELMWYKGNPDLGNLHTFTAGIQQVWMAAEWLTPVIGVRYMDTNPTYTDYYVAPEDMEGLISQSVESVDRMWNINLDLTSNLFNRKVSIRLSPYVLLQQCGSGSYMKRLNT
ncbi:MAG: hypothetical protein K2M03_05250, partial [Muribaculaceae bacterium]|nr:hypothetical protein [Muribaculaceae bacterium]